MLVLSPEAQQKVEEFQAAEAGFAGKAFRITVEAGGCSGFEYSFGFDEPKPDDTALQCGGITVVVDEQSLPYLQGSVIDYYEDFQGSGFAVKNPNSTGSCGCGKSFSA